MTTQRAPIVFQRSGTLGALLCVLSLFGAVATIVAASNKFPSPWQPEWYVLAFAGNALVMLSAIMVLRDTAPRLTIDADGITDHRPSNGMKEHRITWATLRQMDCQITKQDYAVVEAKVLCYVIGKDGRVNDVTIDISGLNWDPELVWKELSKARIEYCR